MFTRFAFLCSALVFGFNLVAVSPHLATTLMGWSICGFASTFLIGSYNERVSAQVNATQAFTAYQLSDLGMLIVPTPALLYPGRSLSALIFFLFFLLRNRPPILESVAAQPRSV